MAEMSMSFEREGAPHASVEVLTNPEQGSVTLFFSDTNGDWHVSLGSTDAHYLATLLKTAVDMIDFRAQLDAHR